MRGANTLMKGSIQFENISRMGKFEWSMCKAMTKFQTFSLMHYWSLCSRTTSRWLEWKKFETWGYERMLEIIITKSRFRSVRSWTRAPVAPRTRTWKKKQHSEPELEMSLQDKIWLTAIYVTDSSWENILCQAAALIVYISSIKI
jgi:hypothetical protein